MVIWLRTRGHISSLEEKKLWDPKAEYIQIRGQEENAWEKKMCRISEMKTSHTFKDAWEGNVAGIGRREKKSS